MKPNAKSVTVALRKVADLDYNTIANGHGPIIRWAPHIKCCIDLFGISTQPLRFSLVL